MDKVAGKDRAKNLKKILMNRKIMLGASAIAVCIALIAVCSFIPFVIDPSRWQTKEFLTDELITVAIVISSMVGAIFIGQASNAQDERSRLSKARAEFFVSIERVVQNINRFTQWIRQVLQKEDLEEIKRRRLREVGIDDISLLNLEFAELRALEETPQKYNGRYYKGLSKQQIKVLIDVKSSKRKIKFVSPDYYLSVKNIIDNRTISERAKDENLKKGLYLSRSIIGKVMITVITSIIFASLMRDMLSQADAGQAWVKFLSRLWSMLTSVFMGYIVGTQINDIDAEYVEMRIQVHKKYLQDNEFVEKDEQQEAKEAYINRVRKEQVNPELAEKNGYNPNLPSVARKEGE